MEITNETSSEIRVVLNNSHYNLNNLRKAVLHLDQSRKLYYDLPAWLYVLYFYNLLEAGNISKAFFNWNQTAEGEQFWDECLNKHNFATVYALKRELACFIIELIKEQLTVKDTYEIW